LNFVIAFSVPLCLRGEYSFLLFNSNVMKTEWLINRTNPEVSSSFISDSAVCGVADGCYSIESDNP